MDVKIAYLYTPIDYKIYIGQPQGFEVEWNIDERPVCILNKSLYSQKQSGRNWNKTLHNCLTKINFI